MKKEDLIVTCNVTYCICRKCGTKNKFNPQLQNVICNNCGFYDNIVKKVMKNQVF